MTELKTVIGHNKYCGPAVLSILTGKSTDECALVISRINGKYNVRGVYLNDLLQALDRLGFDQRFIPGVEGGSLYRTLIFLARTDGMYIIQIPKHYVCVEVKDKNIYFCDNHTKEPIPAASSARLGQRVEQCYRVEKREEPPYIPPIPRVKVTHKVVELWRPDRWVAVGNLMSLPYGEHKIRVREEIDDE